METEPITTAGADDGEGAGGGDHAPVSGGSGAGQPPSVAPHSDAASSVLAFGGQPSGESPAAPASDERLCACGCGERTGGKKYVDETHRKRAVRDRKKKSVPVENGLPSALGEVPAQGSALGGIEVADAVPVVAWEAGDVQELVQQVIALTEEICQRQVQARLSRLVLPAEAVEEIKRDAAWNIRAKEMISAGGAELFAKLMNESGIPVEYRPYLQIVVGAAQIAMGHLRLIKRLDILIKQNGGAPPK